MRIEAPVSTSTALFERYKVDESGKNSKDNPKLKSEASDFQILQQAVGVVLALD
jgi:hypothetical protein